MPETILVVDDEPDVQDLVDHNLRRCGHEVLKASEGNAGLQMAVERIPDLIVLDIMMPGRDGYEVLRVLREDRRTRDIPVVMLTARGQLEDRISGLEHGADDYVSKPFSPRELVLRVNSLLKRAVQPRRSQLLTLGPFQLEKNSLQLFVRGEPVELTPTEFKLMMLFLQRPGTTQSRRDLLHEIWGYDDRCHTRTLDTHIKRLREKLEESASWIRTVRGVGYRLEEP